MSYGCKIKVSDIVRAEKMKILVIRVKGIGNMVMFTPTLVALRKNFPDVKITLLADKGSAEVVRGGNLVDDIVLFDLKFPLSRQLKIILDLRKQNFDCSVMSFPANKWQFNLFAFLIGAKKRITHGYWLARFRTLSFLQNARIPAVEGIHDVEQNLNLLKAFDILDCEKKQVFYVSKEDIDYADRFFKDNNLKNVIAMHPGCGDDSLYKRWPSSHFTRVITLLQAVGYNVLLVAGPGEEELVEDINRSLKIKAEMLSGVPLKQVAAILSRCSAFLSTDSGIGHIASAMRVPTCVITGPTDHIRIAPYGGVVIRKGFPCSPCKKYPFHTDFSHIKCDNILCLGGITPEEVRDKLISVVRLTP